MRYGTGQTRRRRQHRALPRIQRNVHSVQAELPHVPNWSRKDTGYLIKIASHQREQCLCETECIEFDATAVALIAQELAESNTLANTNAASTLAALQDCFYQTRDELSMDVPDDEIVEALVGCFIE